MVPLVAFVKGHPKVVPRAANKLFDGGEKNTRQKKKTFEGLFYSVFGPFADHFLYLFFTLTISPFLSVCTPVPTLFIWPVPTPYTRSCNPLFSSRRHRRHRRPILPPPTTNSQSTINNCLNANQYLLVHFIALPAVGLPHLALAAVGLPHLALAAVGLLHIALAAVGFLHLGLAAVCLLHLALAAVGLPHLALAAVGLLELLMPERAGMELLIL